MQLLPMASSPDVLISARYAVITKTPGWEVLTTISNVNEKSLPQENGRTYEERPESGGQAEGRKLCFLASDPPPGTYWKGGF